MTADEAAAWALRLDGGDLSEAECRALEAWLDGAPGRQAALLDATALWDDLGALDTVAPPARRRRWAGAWNAIAAALVLVVAAVTLLVVHGRSPAIATEVGGQKMAKLDDGSRVTLNTDTRLKLNYSSERRDIELERGEALFEVAHDAARPFVVSVAGRTVTALGTTFVVRRYPDAIGVTLVEGRVRVAMGAAGSATVLAPGERLILDDAGQLHLDRPSIDTVMAWRRGELVFRGTPVAEAVAEMNRYNRVPIRLQASPQGRHINGIFRTDASGDFAEVLAALYGWRYEEGAESIVLSAGSKSAGN